MNELVKNKIFDFAYNEALNDATLQAAYSGKKQDILDKVKAKALVKEYIDSIFGGKPLDFLETAIKVGEEINDREFTFGNVQKLINMTTKYMYMGCYTDESLHEKFKNCDCPMDSQMMAKVKQEYLELLEEEHLGKKSEEYKLLLIPMGNGKTSIDLAKTAWSKIQFDEYDGPNSKKVYDNFQKMVRALAEKNGVSPIELDFFYWGLDD